MLIKLQKYSHFFLENYEEKTMNIDIREITTENLKEVLSLRVSESQKSYIESIEQCLEDAAECDSYRPVGLYKDGELVGFAMYGFFPYEGREGRVWLDRYLIDEHFQGQGLGSIMLEALIAHLVQLYHCDEIYLSLYGDNKRALHLYQKFGFDFNGEKDINAESVMVKKLS
jgi:diamine N-acetyltransferase